MKPSEWRAKKRTTEVLGKKMAYVEMGSGYPIVMVHGNPSSSFLWRSVLPRLQSLGRCIMPDLIGMGDSDKLDDSGPGSYRFVEHRTYLDALFDKLNLNERVVFVIQDWGAGLCFDWANRHRDRVSGIAYMEAIVTSSTWEDFPEDEGDIFQKLRSPAGEEMDEYRRPFAEPGEGRRPTLTWPREIPIEGEPADVEAIVSGYGQWLAQSDIPKLLIIGDPGTILTGRRLEMCRAWPNQKEVTVPGIHFLQEDSGDAIGHAVADWLSRIGRFQETQVERAGPVV